MAMTNTLGVVDDRSQRLLADLYATDQSIRDARPLPEVTEAIGAPGLSLAGLVATVMAGYADRPALGERRWDVVTDPATGRGRAVLRPHFETLSYRALWSRVGAVSAEWYHHERHPLRPGEFVTIIGVTGTDYVTVDLACVRIGAVAVPLQPGTTAAQMASHASVNESRILAVSVGQLDGAVDYALGSQSLRRIIVFDYRLGDDDQRDRVEAARSRLAATPIEFDTLHEVHDRGKGRPLTSDFSGGADEDRLWLLVQTSGSTGTPKSAMYTDKLMKNLWRKLLLRDAGMPMITINFMPLSHIAGRGILYGTLADGGTAYFTASTDMSTLMDDITLVRPTHLVLVPRVCDMLWQRYHSEMQRRAGSDPDRRASLDIEVKAVINALLGARSVFLASGSAPMSAELADFMQSCTGVPIHDIFGSTESGFVLLDHKIVRSQVIDYRLRDVPELGYFTTDVPHPRGELVLRAHHMVPGYYQRHGVTTALAGPDGYYHTGDIMAEVAQDELVYVDRRNNVLKLSQGEFVAVSTLESLFATSPLIRQIYLDGNSEHAYLLAVIVPAEDTPQRGDDLVAAIAESLRRIAIDAGLNSYEIPRDFLLEDQPFSATDGLLSNMGKQVRPKLKERYGRQLKQLYREIAQREVDALRALRNAGAERPVIDAVTSAAQAVLGAARPLPANAHFLDAGGDSLSAVSLTALLKDIFGFDLPIGVVLSPASTMLSIAKHIDDRLSGDRRPTFDSVHGHRAQVIRAGDLTLDKFLPDDLLARASELPKSAGPIHTVLLTGANGYLGRFLCLEWLDRLAEVDGQLICIVRGADPAAARARLVAVFDSGDPDLLERFQRNAGHLEVVSGDLDEPNLGLDTSTWQRLADTVDLVVHPAALVNHILPYSQLFASNVVGTAEVIRMAITSRLKPVVHISTLAVALSQTAGDEADIRLAGPQRQLDDSYANGYTTSKWASEVLLREAHQRFRLPITVFRPNMILIHSRYRGQLNVPDMLTRLLFSILVTGIAPRSFYRADDGKRAHYDGLPVDFTAAAIAAHSEEATEGFQTVNITNPHDDGISLDTFVDWLIEAGHPVTRIDDYQAWRSQFENKLRALPDHDKRYSVLPLLQVLQQPEESPKPSALCSQRVAGCDNLLRLSASLIRKYPEDLNTLGILPG